MATTLPYFRSPRGQCAAAAITISDQSATNTHIILSSSSSSGSDQSFANTLVILSSAATFSAGSAAAVVPDTSVTSSGSDQSFANTLVILSSAATFSAGSAAAVVPDTSVTRGGGEARGGRRSAPRHRRPPSAVAVRSSTVVTAASFANGSGRTTAAPRRSPSPCSVLSVRAPGGGGGGGEEEATSRPKKKYRKWGVEDERKILDTLAKLRRDNLGVAPQASVLLQGILADGGLLRRGVDATDLADKVSKLKNKFKKTAEKLAASGRRRLRKPRDRVLYEASKEAWPDLVPGHGAAAVRLQRRGSNARVRL